MCYAWPKISDLRRTWQLRNDLASGLELLLLQLPEEVRQATFEQLLVFVDGFAPGKAASPEWTASFDRFVEVAWDALDTEMLGELEQAYRQRGPIWAAVAKSFSAENGRRLKERHSRPIGARLPAVVLR